MVEYTVVAGTELSLTVSLYQNNQPATDWPEPSVSMKYGEFLEAVECKKSGDSWILTLKGIKAGREFVTIRDVISGRYLKVWVVVEPAPIQEYLDNSEIKINGSGSAYAYYQGDPGTTFRYSLNGKEALAKSNDKGIIRIPLGTFMAGNIYENTVQFLKAGNKELPPVVVFKPTVTATELEYTHECQVSLAGSVGVALNKGLEVKLGAFNTQATLGKIGVGLEAGDAINITESYSNGSHTLELVNQAAVDAFGSFESGISGENAMIDLDILNSSTKIKATGTGIYGLRIRNYAQENKDAQKAIATFPLGEALKEKSDNVYMCNFQNWLEEKLYTKSIVDVIDGSGAAISGEFEAGALDLEINNIPLVTGLKSDMEATVSISEQSYGNGDTSFSTSYITDVDFNVFSANAVGGAIGADYLGKDITISVRMEDGKKYLETTSLNAEVNVKTDIAKGEQYTADYDQFVFEEEPLDELLKNAKNIDDYVNGSRIAATNADMEDVALALSGNENPIEYANLEKTHFLGVFPVEFGLAIGVGAECGVTVSYMQAVEHKTSGGFVKNDEILLTSESLNYSAEMDEKLLTLDEWIIKSITSLVDEVKNFFEKVVDTIKNGVSTAWGWIEGKADSLSDWMVSLMAASSENAWGESTEIGVLGNQVNFSLARQAANPNDAYVTRTAMTVGHPFVVTVTDHATGEAITNFEEEPLEFTIRYAGEDLLSANYDAEKQVIAMYRYSDNGDYFEYVGGFHDTDANTVTAVITKPGQYILAAEAIPDEEPGEDVHEYDLGDVNHDGKINAKDATLILQKSVGVLKETAKFCEDCAEVSGDGKLNAKDSTLILQFSVGLRKTFPAEQ